MEQRKRRRAFYLKNGYHETGYFMYYMNTEFEIACTDSLFDVAGFQKIIDGIHALVEEFHPVMYKKEPAKDIEKDAAKMWQKI